MQPSSRTASPASRRPLRGFDTEQDSHFRSAPPPNLPASSLQMPRQTRGEYSSAPAPDQAGADGPRQHHSFSVSAQPYPIAGPRQQQSEDPRSLQSPSTFNSTPQFFDGRSSGRVPSAQPGAPGMQPPQQQMQEHGAPLRRGEFDPAYRGGAPTGPMPPQAPYGDAQSGDVASGQAPGFKDAPANTYPPQGQFRPRRRHSSPYADIHRTFRGAILQRSLQRFMSALAATPTMPTTCSGSTLHLSLTIRRRSCTKPRSTFSSDASSRLM